MRLRIRGRVQGVWFRGSTQEEAHALGLAGWVRNLPDGSVEVVAEGEATLVDRLVRWCHEGPPGARVDDVELEREPATGERAPFRIR